MSGIDVILQAIGYYFQPALAAAFFAFIILAAFFIVGCHHVRLRPLRRTLASLTDVLAPVKDAPDDVAARSVFADIYPDVERTALKSAYPPLARAWSEFAESIVDPQAPVLANTVRPEEFFGQFSETSRGLLWWANIAVAVGLVLTFIGIMGALAITSASISGQASAAQEALKSLLNVTAAKFMTSVAGVLASILLRWGDNFYQRAVRTELREFENLLERGLDYIPPQRIAERQLVALREIEGANKKLATELAVAIADQLGQKFEPVIAVLGDVREGIAGLNKGVAESIGEAVGTAAGNELRGLAEALALMTERLGVIPDKLAESADDANRRIVDAANLFSQAASGIESTFDTLGRRIGEMNEVTIARQRESADAVAEGVRTAQTAYDISAKASADAVRESGETMRSTLAEVAATLAAMRGELAAAARRQTETADAAGQRQKEMMEENTERNIAIMRTSSNEASEMLAKMGETLLDMQKRMAEDASEHGKQAAEASARQNDVLEKAGASAAKALQEAAAAAAAQAAELASQQLEAAFARFAERFDVAGARITGAVDGSADRLQAFGGSIERASSGAERQAQALLAGTEAAERLGTAFSTASGSVTSQLKGAAEAMSRSAEPVRQAATAAAEGATAAARAVEAARATGDTQAVRIDQALSALTKAADASTNSFDSYRVRFEEVDKALADALGQLTSNAAKSAESTVEQVGKVDAALANAVTSLSGLVQELSESVDELKTQRMAA